VSALDEAVARLASRAAVVVALAPVDGRGPAAQSAAGARAAGDALIGHADDGRPSWRAGCTGSIAHTDTEAVAARTSNPSVTALGIDVEVSAALAAADARLVLAPSEVALVDAHERPDWAATLLWSAKEAAFKAWSTATEGALGSVDPVEIVVSLDEWGRAFTVGAVGRLGAVLRDLTPVTGFYEEADERVVTLVVARRAPE
jgi:4'-phosphopantetheinyl transferase EntD